VRTETDPSGAASTVLPAMSLVREQVWLVQATVSHVMGVPLGDLCAVTRRRPEAAFARQAAIYLCHVVFGIGITDVARAFGRDPSTVIHAIRRVEEMRDDCESERLLHMLEALLARAWRES
jgi:chromosomal replication initiation ATPase DnaA